MNTYITGMETFNLNKNKFFKKKINLCDLLQPKFYFYYFGIFLKVNIILFKMFSQIIRIFGIL